jgi:hypothetical protein
MRAAGLASVCRLFGSFRFCGRLVLCVVCRVLCMCIVSTADRFGKMLRVAIEGPDCDDGLYTSYRIIYII